MKGAGGKLPGMKSPRGETSVGEKAGVERPESHINSPQSNQGSVVIESLPVYHVVTCYQELVFTKSVQEFSISETTPFLSRIFHH